MTFRQHFPVPHKIIRLLNKRGFRSGGDGWSCVCCDDARVKPGIAQGGCRVGQRSATHPIREYEGEIFIDYYFGEANTANNSDKHHNIAINEKLNSGGFPGCYKSLTLYEIRKPKTELLRFFRLEIALKP